MPKAAARDGVEGTVKAEATIRNGSVISVRIISGPRVFQAAVRDAMMQYRCVTGAGDILATQDFVFKLE